LRNIFILFSGQSTDAVCASVSHLNTGQYKLHLSELLVEHFSPIREKIEYYLKHQEHLEDILSHGSKRAEDIAEKTMEEVKSAIGLRN
jgi:tryptophanyl-tRNA synthetase